MTSPISATARAVRPQRRPVRGGRHPGLHRRGRAQCAADPQHAALINIRYDSFDAALRDARALVAMQAASIETVDSRVLALARNDIVWHEVREFFPDDPEGPAEGVNLVELLADEADELEAQLARHDHAGARRPHMRAPRLHRRATRRRLRPAWR